MFRTTKRTNQEIQNRLLFITTKWNQMNHKQSIYLHNLERNLKNKYAVGTEIAKSNIKKYIPT